MNMTRRRLLDDTFQKSVVGNPAIATDSLARMYPGIVMNGWTTQESTTGAQLFDKSTIEPGKYVFDTDGKIYDTSSNYKTAASDYVLVSGLSYICATVTSYRQWMAFYDSEKTYISGKTGYSVPIAVPEGAVYARFTISNDYIDSFMVNEGQVLLTYEPYTDGKPSPSPEYPQQIISAGTYNQETGKWEYEITIANAQTDPKENQTVTLTADRPLTKWDRLEKRNGQWGWVYKSAEIESYTDESVPGEYYSTTGQLSIGAQVWYETTTETFVPLTASEQEAMNALHTYRPITVLSNQQDCQMALTYKTRKGVGGGNPYGLELGGFVTADGREADGNPQIRIRTGYIPYISGQIFQMKAPIRYRLKYILFYESNETTDSFVETRTLSIVGERSYTMPENSGKYFRLSIEKIDNKQAMTDQDLEDLKRNLIMIVR